jgi:transposase
MASIIKKTIKGNRYYYARECQRVNGRPKIVWQKYLGRADDILAKLSQVEAPVPQEADVIEFGLTAALHDIAARIDLVGVIDRHCPKREQGITVGRYMLLAAINRCSDPTSKNKIGQWHQSTALRYLMPVDPSALTSQRFWDHMSLLDREKIHAIERDLAKILVDQEGVELGCLLYDTTNFFTYIDSRTKSDIPQRGHNKQKRDDLKQIGLALLVSRDSHVPLYHDVYSGNVHDSAEFASVTEALIKRYEDFSAHCRDITLVFDKGNNSHSNIESCKPYHYVGSLVASQYPDLLSIALDEYQNLPTGYKVYMTRKKVFGSEHTICLTWNAELFDSQMRGLMQQLAKRTKKLDALAAKLAARSQGIVKKGRKPTAAAVKRLADQIASGHHIEQIIKSTITEESGNVLFHYSVDEEAIERIATTLFGKNVLFTDREDMDAASIVDTYHAQYKIEDAFKQMKDPRHVSFSPMYHWTDQKIRVHAFYCVLALMLSSLLSRRIHKLGMSIGSEEAHRQLSEIRELTLSYPANRGEPKSVTMIAKMNNVQSKLFKVLNLRRFIQS